MINKNLGAIDPDVRMNAFMEVINAANGLGDSGLAKKAALEIAKEHPDMPSIQKYLRES